MPLPYRITSYNLNLDCESFVIRIADFATFEFKCSKFSEMICSTRNRFNNRKKYLETTRISKVNDVNRLYQLQI